MLRLSAKYLVALSLGVLLVGCGDSSPAQPPGTDMAPTLDPTWASIYMHSVTGTCTFSSCHNMTSHKGNLDMSDMAAACTNLVGVPAHNAGVPGMMRVMPGDPMNSFLYLKLSTTEMQGCTLEDGGGPGQCIVVNGMTAGERMPKTNDPTAYLDAASLDQVKQWIAAGAPCQ